MTPGRRGNPPVHIISHFNAITVTSDRLGDPPHVTTPIWGPPPPCKHALGHLPHVESSKRAS